MKPQNAFPQDLRDSYTGNIVNQENGMTLRDYFAAKAMQGIIASATAPLSAAPKMAYEIADKMLQERKNQNQ